MIRLEVGVPRFVTGRKHVILENKCAVVCISYRELLFTITLLKVAINVSLYF